ncbi:MAG: response regulator [Pyrinomonadaceae bacterium]
MINILFVDDEPLLLHGVQRMLRDRSNVWDMDFVDSGEAALARFEEKKFDVVVSDMRMPDMDGGELLNRVKEKWPDCVRIILSGFSEKDMILRSVGTAHQYLSKPFNADGLAQTIDQALSLRDLLTDSRLQRLVARIEQLPSLPRIYQELVDELSKEDPSSVRIARIINSDIGMTAKILQIMNSAFFGLRRSVTDVPDAVRMLGTDTLKALTLSVGVFAQIEVPREFSSDLKRIWNHSTKVGLAAKAIATMEGSSMTDEAFTVGFLHEVGTLVMILNLPDLYRDVEMLCNEQGMNRFDAEMEVYGTTHGAIGAYLLGLWGLPRNMIEAVAFYHAPGSYNYHTFRPLTALHIAHVLTENKEETLEDIMSKVDLPYLEKADFNDKIESWYELYHHLSEPVAV